LSPRLGLALLRSSSSLGLAWLGYAAAAVLVIIRYFIFIITLILKEWLMIDK